jgi:hypothetical protein
MSPEQIEGHAVDSRSDLYSAGIILYFMLTKKRPFEGDIYSVIQSHQTAPRPDPNQLNPGMPDFLRRMYFKMTKIKPEDRYQSFKDVFEEAGRFLSSVSAPEIREPRASEDEGTRMMDRGKTAKKPLAKAPAEPGKPSGRLSGRKILAAAAAGAFVVVLAVILILVFIRKDVPTDLAGTKSPETSVQGPRPEEEGPPLEKKDAAAAHAMAVSVTGGRTVREDLARGKVFYTAACSGCGKEDGQVREAALPEQGQSRFQVFSCPQCGKKQIVVIQRTD